MHKRGRSLSYKSTNQPTFYVILDLTRILATNFNVTFKANYELVTLESVKSQTKKSIGFKPLEIGIIPFWVNHISSMLILSDMSSVGQCTSLGASNRSPHHKCFGD